MCEQSHSLVFATKKARSSLIEALGVGWKNCQPDKRPYESFRAMLIAMEKFINYLELKCVNAAAQTVN